MPVSTSVSALRLTYFHADKLHHAGGISDRFSNAQRQSSPYRVTTYRGPELGLAGSLPAILYKLHGVNSAEAANQESSNTMMDSVLEKFRLHYLQL